jgi:hypothetical protein
MSRRCALLGTYRAPGAYRTVIVRRKPLPNHVHLILDDRRHRSARAAPNQRPPTVWGTALANAARAAGPPLLFGVRLWASVCLALYVAFWLQLENPYWAGTTAALVCQPHLGASLRRGWFRLIGTIVGGAAIVVLTKCFPQDRAGFLVGLATWGAVCALATTVFRNALGIAAAIAGSTAAIIASDELGAIGGPNGQAFVLAVIRCSEICIGIVCAGIILAGTDFGGSSAGSPCCSLSFLPRSRSGLPTH